MVDSCKQQFAPAAGYGWEDDLTIGTAPPGSQGVPVPPARERVVADCSAAGQPESACNGELLLTRETAMCIAKSRGLKEGVAPWKAGLTYHAKHQRIVWNVHSTSQVDGNGQATGDAMTIDAISGANLDSTLWSSIS